MRGHDLILAAVTALFLGGGLSVTAGGAYAQSLCTGQADNQCTAFCGDAGVASCTKTSGNVDCVCNSTTKDVRGNAYGTATQDTAEGEGNLQPAANKPREECTGNQGQCKQQ
jgi:hypothetical protein